ncbi:cytochrome c oxidase subunit 3 [Winogradskyella aurantiaca]|uniref:cytochrome c oxidase subunit 3 n=1 Tax=Winogradskyella aurantiaca TaxID=2219558 RepID=UPI000E1CA715|nr:cytochrome c oxidase subunit 3 [Winogradskyella aurantiaca]
MDLTQGTPKEKKARSKKMMLWFGILSLIMSFAALTSAFIVSSKRDDWLDNFQLPDAFFVSLVVILISSVAIMVAKYNLRRDKLNAASFWVLITLVLGIIFINNQFIGFSQIIGEGYNFTGPTSNITMSYVFLIATVHIAHVVVALIALGVILIKNLRKKYNSQDMLGFELAANFWHFVDLLWLYLFLFLYFFRYII